MANGTTSDADRLLAENAAQTLFPSLTSDVTLVTSAPESHTQRMRVLQTWKPAAFAFDSMSCLVEGNPNDFRFLIEAHLDQKSPAKAFAGWCLFSRTDHVRRLAPSPWDPVPGLDLRSMDLSPVARAILAQPPGVPNPAPAPTGPGGPPPAGCVVVELKLVQPPTIHLPDRVLIWLDPDPARRVEHRVEHHLKGHLLRVMTAQNWQQAAGGTWLATSRTYIDPLQASTTELTIDRFRLDPIPSGTIGLANLPSTTWPSTPI